jgi:hypothetical protein
MSRTPYSDWSKATGRQADLTRAILQRGQQLGLDSDSVDQVLDAARAETRRRGMDSARLLRGMDPADLAMEEIAEEVAEQFDTPRGRRGRR